MATNQTFEIETNYSLISIIVFCMLKAHLYRPIDHKNNKKEVSDF